MKVWTIQYAGVETDGRLYWSGSDLAFTTHLEKAVAFVRQEDAERVMRGMPTMNGRSVEVELPATAQELRPTP